MLPMVCYAGIWEDSFEDNDASDWSVDSTSNAKYYDGSYSYGKYNNNNGGIGAVFGPEIEMPSCSVYEITATGWIYDDGDTEDFARIGVYTYDSSDSLTSPEECSDPDNCQSQSDPNFSPWTLNEDEGTSKWRYREVTYTTPEDTCKLKFVWDGADDAGSGANYYNAYLDFVNISWVSPSPPEFDSFSFDCSIDEINIYWDINYYRDDVNVQCTLNDDPNNRCDYSGPTGSNGCFIDSPDYITTQDGELTRTVQNKLNCTAYDSLFSTENINNFYPVAFEISIPSSVSVLLGDAYSFAFTIKNTGTLTESYDISMITDNEESLIIYEPNQNTENLTTNAAQKIYTDITLLNADTNVDLIVTVTPDTYPDIQSTNVVTVKGNRQNLPEFGRYGILGVLAGSIVILSFLL